MNKAIGWKMGALALVIAAQTSAGFLDVTEGYSVMSFGDVNVFWSDAQGKVAGAGDVSVEAYNIGGSAPASLYSLVGGGDVTFKNGTISNGGLYAGGNADIYSATINGDVAVEGNLKQQGGGTYDNFIVGGTANVDGYLRSKVIKADPGTSPINFADKEVKAIALSSSYANNAANGTIVNNGGKLTLIGADDVNYFSLSGSDLSMASSLTFDLASNGTSIINVSGTSNSLKNFNFFNYDATKILFNFYESNSLEIASVGVKGSILAALADVNFVSGHIDGSLVSKTLDGYGEFHKYDFIEPPTNNVPESSTTVMMVAGALVLVVVTLRKKFSFSRN